MDEKERERIWKEMVDKSARIGWREELIKDLKAFMIVFVFWIGFVSIIEITGV